MNFNILADAIKVSFENWLAKDATYKPYAKKMTENMYAMLYASFDEMHDYKPGIYDYWYVCNHMRFQHIRQEDKSLVNELAYHYLTKYARDELGSATMRKARPGKTKG